jgi:hypothetical protein
MAKGTTRHLKYVWIEYGNPKDGAAFTDGLYALGWGNLVGELPAKNDAWGQRRVDSAHPLLPVRYRGSGLLVLPNNRVDDKDRNFPYIDDPIFSTFRKANGDTTFDAEIVKQNEFIAKWMFSPGLKKNSDSDVALTLGADFTEYADWATISGHGAGGTCWGGGSGAELKSALRVPPDPATDRLKYVTIATCYNVMEFNAPSWLPAMRRSNPIHGFLGYGSGYPGDEPGEAFFKAFIKNLNAKASAKDDAGTKTILDAWREAHSSAKDIWAALIHTSSKGDTMKDWLAGKLAQPSAGGEIRWFDESNYPTGKVMVDRTPPITVFFFMGTTKIDRTNNDRKDVGLFPGDNGVLEITNTSGSFSVGDVVTIMFYYFRPNKDGMDLPKLLKFGASTEGTVTLKTDLNKEDGSKNVDALEFKLTTSVAKARIPYTVETDATKSYHKDGETHGYFNLRITPPGETVGGNKDLRPYPDGAWLRPKP